MCVCVCDDSKGDRCNRMITFNVCFGAQKIASKLGAGVIAYVHQDDAMFPMLTVEQTLMYAALLRLPTTMSWSKKLERVSVIDTNRRRNTPYTHASSKESETYVAICRFVM